MTTLAILLASFLIAALISALVALYWAGHDHQAYFTDVPSRFAFVKRLPFRVSGADSAGRKVGFVVLGSFVVAALLSSMVALVSMGALMGKEIWSIAMLGASIWVGAVVGGKVATRLVSEIWPGTER